MKLPVFDNILHTWYFVFLILAIPNFSLCFPDD